MDVQSIEDLVLQLLADDLGVTAEDMRAELLDAGAQLPIDSLLLVEIIVRIEDQLGFKIPETPDIAKTMTSVHAFSEALAELVVATNIPAQVAAP